MTDLVSPRFAEITLPLGLTVWLGDEDNPNFVLMRQFLNDADGGAGYEDQITILRYGMRNARFLVRKLAPSVVELDLSIGLRIIKAVVSGEIGDFLRIDQYLGLVLNGYDRMTATFVFYEYERMMAIRRSIHWPSWADSHNFR